MVKNGTLLSLDDFWSFQSNLYQTIITVLIALNAIIAAFSFFIIKNSSIENAREEARNEAVSEVRRYIESIVFNNEIKSILDEKIKSLQLDLASQIETVDELILTCNVGEINKLSIDYSELRRQLKVLAERVSELDKDETDGKELIIGHKV
ncbi:transmembrane HD family hydrolase [Pectobacterium polaris]|nr:transmembrane HD family hydrolase [Pectobacterium polaris]